MPSDKPATMEVDHYAILGLPSGVQGAKVSHENIMKAYKLKALKLHPDKRRDDPDAHKKFLRLQNSYEILKEIRTRKAYDNRIRLKNEKIIQDLKHQEMMARKKAEQAMKKARDEIRKKRFQEMTDELKKIKEEGEKLKWEAEKIMDDLIKKQKEVAEKRRRDEEERKRREMLVDLNMKKVLAEKKAALEKERKRREMLVDLNMKKELAEKKAALEKERKRQKMMADLKKKGPTQLARHEKEWIRRKLKFEIAKICATGLEDGKMLKVSWDKIGEHYSAQRLRELFREFGEVPFVITRSCKNNKVSAFIVMASKDAAVAATRCVIGDLDNQLQVLPVLRPVSVVFKTAQQFVHFKSPESSSFIDGEYEPFENSLLAKLRKMAAERRKRVADRRQKTAADRQR